MSGAASTSPSQLNLSPEETAELRRFADLVARWNLRINLVSKASVPEIWSRHILDSAQIYDLAPAGAQTWMDLGSGGGFPGIVIAILARFRNPKLKITLVESDQRKAVFLRQVIRELGLAAVVRSERIEKIRDERAEVVSARALAALPELFALAEPLLAHGGTCLFAKGSNRQQELDAARQSWDFHVEEFLSVTDPAAAVLKVTGLHHV